MANSERKLGSWFSAGVYDRTRRCLGNICMRRKVLFWPQKFSRDNIFSPNVPGKKGGLGFDISPIEINAKRAPNFRSRFAMCG